MILPIKESGVNCFDRLSYIHSLGEDDILTEKIEDTFTENPDYVPVYRNFDYSKTFDIWCYNGTAPDKTQPYKRFLSYPYPEIEFRIGDYISFDYRQDGTMSHFLVESCDYQKKYDINGRMWLVNQELKWVDDNSNLYIYQAVFEDAVDIVAARHSDVTLKTRLIQGNSYNRTILSNNYLVGQRLAIVSCLLLISKITTSYYNF